MTEKSRGRNKTPSQRRFPNLRGRSSSRGRSATPTNQKDDGTPSKRNFTLKKLIPRSNSRSRASPSQAASVSKITPGANNNKQEEVENVVVSVSPKQTRSVNDIALQESGSERDAPEGINNSSSSDNVKICRKKIHSESERDGFCRRVDYYDGQTIHVDGIPTYEVGNYLGGGVAGVVYEGQRLRPVEEYPVRNSYQEVMGIRGRANSLLTEEDKYDISSVQHETMGGCTGIFCGPSHDDLHNDANDLKLELLVDDKLMSPQAKQLARGEKEREMMKDETVAIKILNPVGFRLLSPSACASAVVVKRGKDMDDDVKAGVKPMRESHVWWMVNPSSKNLRYLQREPSPIAAKDGEKMGLSSDMYNRGTKDQGIRLSLVAAYRDPKTNALRELTLTRCIEIWGHAPFGTSEEEFESMMDAIERVNHGQSGGDFEEYLGNNMSQKDFGLFRAAVSQKMTVYCDQLNAYVTVPVVPPKYIRWLRQRRAATKEIRNMMRIGRHKNVVHLFEVMELVQDSKSTMFLVLELVKGGELFDLISTNSHNTAIPHESLSHLSEAEQNEFTMLNFFRELASGVAYCHANGIAHRDLKPENLLVHNESNGNCTLKIADFGLSSTFVLAKGEQPNQSNRGCGINSTPSSKPPPSPSPVTGFSPLISHKLTTALSFLTCGGMEQITECFGSFSDDPRTRGKSLHRMTSIVGSPHYVAPEIISQTDEKKPSSISSTDMRGYDGTKADVWSAGVILYAMLFKSLPFGEDLLRCPRYQSFIKWYDEARKSKTGRRINGTAALRPIDIMKDAEDLGPHWFFPSRTSPESKDIIVAMLNPNPLDRLDIQQVLIHPWMNLKAGSRR